MYTLDRWAKAQGREIPNSLIIMFMIVYPNLMYIGIGQWKKKSIDRNQEQRVTLVSRPQNIYCGPR